VYMMNIIQTEDYISDNRMNINDFQSPIILVPTTQNHRKSQNHMIQSNYYSMLCTESRRDQTIHYNFQGRINEPNIIHRSKQTGIKMGYQSMELCLCPTLASFSEFPFLQSFIHQHPEKTSIHGAIVISHRPLMNGPPLYSCFFLINRSSQITLSQNTESLERLFQYSDNMKQVNQTEPAHITMNDFVYASRGRSEGSNAGVSESYSEGRLCEAWSPEEYDVPQVTEFMFQNRLCTVVFYPTPIAIQFPRIKMMGGNRSHVLLHDSQIKRTDTIVKKIQEGFQEGMDSNCDSLSMAHCTNTINDDCTTCDINYVPVGDDYHRRCRPMAGSSVPDDACVHNAAPVAAVTQSIPSYMSPLLNKYFSLTQNGNPNKYGNPSSMCSVNAGNPPDLSNLPKVPTTYSGAPILQLPDAKINSDTTCGSFDTVMQKYINNIKGNSGSQDITNILLAIYDYRKNNDGLNPYMGGSGSNPTTGGTGIDCYQDYVNTFWGGEGTFLNFLITQGVTIPPQYNYWNAQMGPTTNYGWDPASIFYNVDGHCYDTSTVELNAGLATAAGYDAVANLQKNVIYDISNAANSAMSMANHVMGVISGTDGSCPTKGPQVTIQVPLNDDPNYTYQECSMVPGDDMTVEPVYYTSQQQFFDLNNSLMGIVFYFIIFLIVYFGTPFMYYFMMCVVLKHGYNYTGSATMGDYLRKPQTGIGGKSRGLSIIFNAVYWMMIFVIYMITFIPGANVTKYNTFIILLMISWVIGYIGVKNNPPPDSCMY